MDYPGFKANDFNDIRICSFEIYPKETRMKVFGELLKTTTTISTDQNWKQKRKPTR